MQGAKAAIGAKPLFLFQGSSWDTNVDLSNVKDFILGTIDPPEAVCVSSHFFTLHFTNLQTSSAGDK